MKIKQLMTKAYHTIIKLFQKLAVTNVDQIHMFNSWRIKTQIIKDWQV